MRCPGRPRGAPCRCAPLRAAARGGRGKPADLQRGVASFPFSFPPSALLLLAVWGVPSCPLPAIQPSPPWVISGCSRAGLGPSPAAERTCRPRCGLRGAGRCGAECRRRVRLLREPVPQPPFSPLSPSAECSISRERSARVPERLGRGVRRAKLRALRGARRGRLRNGGGVGGGTALRRLERGRGSISG